MKGLAIQKDNLPTQFQPDQTFHKQAQLDAIIELARKTKNWEALEDAIEIKVADQKEFLEWWGSRVTIGQSPGRGNKSISDTEIVLSADRATELTGFTPLQVTRLKKKLMHEDSYRAQLFGAAYKKAFPDESLVDKMTGDEESYTPAKYLESARVVMGGIDLDPASNEMAQEDVQATTYYTVHDDGLSQEWAGRVWMNPPYTARVINQFIDKAVRHYQAGEITQAIILTNNNTDTSWFHQGAGAASAICFTAGRINFLKPDGSRSSPTNGQSFFYLGHNLDAFKEEFSQYGLVMVKA